MGEELQQLRDDIAFVRAVAEEGNKSLAHDGAVLAAAGAVFSLTSFQYWLIFTGILVVPRGWARWLWLDGTVVFFVAMAFIRARMPRQLGAVSRVTQAAWTGVGTGITVGGAALGLGAWRLGLPLVVTGAFPILLFTLYGAAWGIAFAVRRRTALALVAIGCFVVAVACGILMGEPQEWLALALGLLLLVAGPGTAIVLQSRRDQDGN
jgi:hypothetical protein